MVPGYNSHKPPPECGDVSFQEYGMLRDSTPGNDEGLRHSRASTAYFASVFPTRNMKFYSLCIISHSFFHFSLMFRYFVQVRPEKLLVARTLSKLLVLLKRYLHQVETEPNAKFEVVVIYFCEEIYIIRAEVSTYRHQFRRARLEVECLGHTAANAVSFIALSLLKTLGEEVALRTLRH